MSRSSLAAVRAAEPEAAREEDAAAGAADGALSALAQAARLVEALAAAGPGEKPLLTAAMMRLAQATQAAEELRSAFDDLLAALAGQEIRVRAIADAAFAAGAASRHLRVAAG